MPWNFIKENNKPDELKDLKSIVEDFIYPKLVRNADEIWLVVNIHKSSAVFISTLPDSEQRKQTYADILSSIESIYDNKSTFYLIEETEKAVYDILTTSPYVNTKLIKIKTIEEFDFKRLIQLILFCKENEQEYWKTQIHNAYKDFLLTEHKINLKEKLDIQLISNFNDFIRSDKIREGILINFFIKRMEVEEGELFFNII